MNTEEAQAQFVMRFIERTDVLAKELFDCKRFAEAAHVAEAVIGLTDGTFGSFLNAARCHIYGGDPERAEELLNRARVSDSRALGDTSDMQVMVLALVWQGKFSEAEAVIRKLEDSPEKFYNLGWHALRRGNIKDAFPLLEHGRSIGVWGDNDFHLTTRRWDGVSDLKGKSVLLNLERGLGDHIIEARHARDLAALGAIVTIRTNQSLVATLSQAEGVVGATSNIVPHDVWVPGMAVPALLHMEKLDGRPYLKPIPYKAAEWAERLGKKTKPRIGIRWRGNPKFEDEQRRKFPPELLFNALRGMGDLFSFQRDEGTEFCPPYIRDLSSQLVTWEDTCAALSQMDVVVSSCTSIVHAAAAMGVNTIVITPILSYYPWADETILPRSNWYDSVLVTKQAKIGRWNEAIDLAAEHVQTFLSAKK